MFDFKTKQIQIPNFDFELDKLEERILLSADPITAEMVTTISDKELTEAYHSKVLIEQNKFIETVNNEVVIDFSKVNNSINSLIINNDNSTTGSTSSTGYKNLNLINNGTVNISESLGSLEVQNYEQERTATLNIQIAQISNVNKADKLIVKDKILLDGQIIIDLSNAKKLQVGDSFEIIKLQNDEAIIVGDFKNIEIKDTNNILDSSLAIKIIKTENNTIELNVVEKKSDVTISLKDKDKDKDKDKKENAALETETNAILNAYDRGTVLLGKNSVTFDGTLSFYNHFEISGVFELSYISNFNVDINMNINTPGDNETKTINNYTTSALVLKTKNGASFTVKEHGIEQIVFKSLDFELLFMKDSANRNSDKFTEDDKWMEDYLSDRTFVSLVSIKNDSSRIESPKGSPSIFGYDLTAKDVGLFINSSYTDADYTPSFSDFKNFNTNFLEKENFSLDYINPAINWKNMPISINEKINTEKFKVFNGSDKFRVEMYSARLYLLDFVEIKGGIYLENSGIEKANINTGFGNLGLVFSEIPILNTLNKNLENLNINISKDLNILNNVLVDVKKIGSLENSNLTVSLGLKNDFNNIEFESEIKSFELLRMIPKNKLIEAMFNKFDILNVKAGETSYKRTEYTIEVGLSALELHGKINKVSIEGLTNFLLDKYSKGTSEEKKAKREKLQSFFKDAAIDFSTMQNYKDSVFSSYKSKLFEGTLKDAKLIVPSIFPELKGDLTFSKQTNVLVEISKGDLEDLSLPTQLYVDGLIFKGEDLTGKWNLDLGTDILEYDIKKTDLTFSMFTPNLSHFDKNEKLKNKIKDKIPKFITLDVKIEEATSRVIGGNFSELTLSNVKVKINTITIKGAQKEMAIAMAVAALPTINFSQSNIVVAKEQIFKDFTGDIFKISGSLKSHFFSSIHLNGKFFIKKEIEEISFKDDSVSKMLTYNFAIYDAEGFIGKNNDFGFEIKDVDLALVTMRPLLNLDANASIYTAIMANIGTLSFVGIPGLSNVTGLKDWKFKLNRSINPSKSIDYSKAKNGKAYSLEVGDNTLDFDMKEELISLLGETNIGVKDLVSLKGDFEIKIGYKEGSKIDILPDDFTMNFIGVTQVVDLINLNTKGDIKLTRKGLDGNLALSSDVDLGLASLSGDLELRLNIIDEKSTSISDETSISISGKNTKLSLLDTLDLEGDISLEIKQDKTASINIKNASFSFEGLNTIDLEDSSLTLKLGEGVYGKLNISKKSIIIPNVDFLTGDFTLYINTTNDSKNGIEARILKIESKNVGLEINDIGLTGDLVIGISKDKLEGKINLNLKLREGLGVINISEAEMEIGKDFFRLNIQEDLIPTFDKSFLPSFYLEIDIENSVASLNLGGAISAGIIDFSFEEELQENNELGYYIDISQGFGDTPLKYLPFDANLKGSISLKKGIDLKASGSIEVKEGASIDIGFAGAGGHFNLDGSIDLKITNNSFDLSYSLSGSATASLYLTIDNPVEDPTDILPDKITVGDKKSIDVEFSGSILISSNSLSFTVSKVIPLEIKHVGSKDIPLSYPFSKPKPDSLKCGLKKGSELTISKDNLPDGKSCGNNIIIDQEGNDVIVIGKYGREKYSGINSIKIEGTDSKDNIRVINSNKTININTKDGNDKITIEKGVSGKVTINAEDGNDILNIKGGSSTSVINAGDGNDIFNIQNINNGITYHGGSGDDICNGTKANETFITGSGNDTIFTGGGNDEIEALEINKIYLNAENSNIKIKGGVNTINSYFFGKNNIEITGKSNNTIIGNDAKEIVTIKDFNSSDKTLSFSNNLFDNNNGIKIKFERDVDLFTLKDNSSFSNVFFSNNWKTTDVHFEANNLQLDTFGTNISSAIIDFKAYEINHAYTEDSQYDLIVLNDLKTDNFSDKYEFKSTRDLSFSKDLQNKYLKNDFDLLNIEAKNINITSNINTQNAVTLNSKESVITTNSTISSNKLAINAGQNIGTKSNRLNTNVNSISLESKEGNIYIKEDDGLAINKLQGSKTSDILVKEGKLNSTTNLNFDEIILEVRNSSFSMDENTSINSNILNIKAKNDLELEQINSNKIDLEANNINLNETITSSKENINITAFSNINFKENSSIIAKDNITLNAINGFIKMAEKSLIKTNKDITLDSSDDLLLSKLETISNIQIDTKNIVDINKDELNIEANDLIIKASENIGTSLHYLDTSINSLSSNSKSLYLKEKDSLITKNIETTDSIDIIANESISQEKNSKIESKNSSISLKTKNGDINIEKIEADSNVSLTSSDSIFAVSDENLITTNVLDIKADENIGTFENNINTEINSLSAVSKNKSIYINEKSSVSFERNFNAKEDIYLKAKDTITNNTQVNSQNNINLIATSIQNSQDATIKTRSLDLTTYNNIGSKDNFLNTDINNLSGTAGQNGIYIKNSKNLNIRSYGFSSIGDIHLIGQNIYQFSDMYGKNSIIIDSHNDVKIGQIKSDTVTLKSGLNGFISDIYKNDELNIVSENMNLLGYGVAIEGRFDLDVREKLLDETIDTSTNNIYVATYEKDDLKIDIYDSLIGILFTEDTRAFLFENVKDFKQLNSEINSNLNENLNLKKVDFYYQSRSLSQRNSVEEIPLVDFSKKENGLFSKKEDSFNEISSNLLFLNQDQTSFSSTVLEQISMLPQFSFIDIDFNAFNDLEDKSLLDYWIEDITL